jgi:hypothetical protein
MLAAASNVCRAVVSARWHVTARNTSGQLEGVVNFNIPGETLASDSRADP